MTGLPYPTPTRLRLADAIAAGQVKHYHWINPWTCDTVRDRNVTSRVAELVAAGLAEIPAAGGNLPESHVRLTPEGMAWVTRARTADDKIVKDGPVSTSPQTGPRPASITPKVAERLARSLPGAQPVGGRCSGCYDSFSGPWCDNCDRWPCTCGSDAA